MKTNRTQQLKRKLIGKRWLLLFPLFFSFAGFAQRELNLLEHDAKPYYFGISLGMNQSRFRTSPHPNFLEQDTILVAESVQAPGFNLGLSATLRLGSHLEIRANPQLYFLDRPIEYQLKYPDRLDNAYTIQKRVESVMVSAPLQLRFLSDRIGNFRVYMMGGGKLDYDLSSNAQSRNAEDMVKIRKYDYGIEGGIGFKFYYPSFILAPEIKISNGFRNMHGRDSRLNYSNVIDKINSRMIVFTLNIEG